MICIYMTIVQKSMSMRTSKIRFGLLVVALALFVAACGGGGAKPGDVAKNFLTAVNDLNFEEAKKYATAESASMLDMMGGLMNMGGEEMEKPEPQEITITNEEVDGDNATVTYTTKDEEGNDVEETIDLVKVDEEWKVKFDKSSLGGGDMGDIQMDDFEMEEEGDLTEEMEDVVDDMEDVVEEMEDVVEEAQEEVQPKMDGGQN